MKLTPNTVLKIKVVNLLQLLLHARAQGVYRAWLDDIPGEEDSEAEPKLLSDAECGEYVRFCFAGLERDLRTSRDGTVYLKGSK